MVDKWCYNLNILIKKTEEEKMGQEEKENNIFIYLFIQNYLFWAYIQTNQHV
jgi:hypothetical protein